ncbi:DegT/DnrJ/EryC1/StrS family aminotransferase, partial [Actinobacillus pleuropneumoniae]
CPPECEQNGHLFYLKWRNSDERNDFIERLKQHGILAVFHYVPLHSSPAGQRFGSFIGEDRFTTSESERLVRLPLFYNLQPQESDKIIRVILEFLHQCNH